MQSMKLLLQCLNISINYTYLYLSIKLHTSSHLFSDFIISCRIFSLRKIVIKYQGTSEHYLKIMCKTSLATKTGSAKKQKIKEIPVKYFKFTRFVCLENINT